MAYEFFDLLCESLNSLSVYSFGSFSRRPLKRSALKRQISNNIKHSELNPYWLTGFCDGEATFSVTIRENPSKNGIGWQVLFTFQIGLHSRDTAILKESPHPPDVGALSEGYKVFLWQPAEQDPADLTPPVGRGLRPSFLVSGLPLDPYWVSGFSEGSFFYFVQARNRRDLSILLV
jgi:hypothetical protein